MRDIGEWRPGFYTEFRCASREHSGLAWGAIFEKMFKFQEMHASWFWTCPKNQEIGIFPGQKPRRELQDIKELFRIRKWKYKLPRCHLQKTFSKSYLHKINSFSCWNGTLFFSPKKCFSIFYCSKSHFGWKSKWSVWSLGTFSTMRIWNFRMEKGSYGGKLKL